MSSAFGPAAAPISPLSPKDASLPLISTPKTVSDAAASAGHAASDGAATAVRQKLAALLANMELAIMGKREAVKLTMVGLLARGHVLIEDVPGVGKTTLARALAKSIDCEFRRIQFTPDLLPSDVMGVSIFDQKEGRFKFHCGPLFANVILADEINRTTPRTQSALLEAMNEAQVSIDQGTFPLPRPFVVLATQNPQEHQGTYPLPESQLDRFLLRIGIGYPSRDDERSVLRGAHQPASDLEPVVTLDEILQLQRAAAQVKVADGLLDYALAVVTETRSSPLVSLGVSPRGAKAWFRAAQAHALAEGRAFAVPDDFKRTAIPALAHRISIGGPAGLRGGRTDAERAISDILERTPIPE